MRTLASIQSIHSNEPIPKADAIERLRVLGWWVVAKKGDYVPGDKVVYCEIDSLLPERAEFEFLRGSSYKAPQIEGASVVQRAGFRIKTVKLRGQVSQGICFPLSILPPGTPTEIGTDVSDALGIIKYEPPVAMGMSGRVRGGFPGFLSKTDETRVQVLEPVLLQHKGKTFYQTEKLDGTSFTAFLRDGQFGICSRNLWMDETDDTNLLARVARGIDLEAKLWSLHAKHGFWPAIQGEIIGPGIQKNRYARKLAELHVFNVLNLDTAQLVDHDIGVSLINEAGLIGVPQLGTLVLNHSIDELVALSAGPSVLNPQVPREGIVLRPATEEFDETLGGRLSFKIINPQFLLKFDE